MTLSLQGFRPQEVEPKSYQSKHVTNSPQWGLVDPAANMEELEDFEPQDEASMHIFFAELGLHEKCSVLRLSVAAK